jgi:hypothetical protein
MSQENVDVFAEAMRAAQRQFDEGDFERAFAGLAFDVEWDTASYVIDGGLLRGRQAVIDYFVRNRDAGDWSVEAQDFTNAGEGRIVVHQRGRAAGRTTRIEGTIDFFQVWEFGADGLVVRVREYESRSEALKAVGMEDGPQTA